MKICFIAKQPPIQGGVSRTCYWLAAALAQSGIEIHVVTNANSVEDTFRIHNFWPEESTPHDNWPTKIFVHQTGPSGNHIPSGPDHLTKLASLATKVVREQNCDLIYAYYFEPYGLAAHLASQWTGVPFGVRHAGSDVGRLMRFEQHGIAYREMLKTAAFIHASPSTYRRFIHLGIDIDQIYPAIPTPIPDENHFTPTAAPLDFNNLRERVLQQLPKNSYFTPYHQSLTKPINPDLPTIAIYGKVGPQKGSHDIIHALQRLKDEGLKFNFVALTQGGQKQLADFVTLLNETGVAPNCWLFPFIPHWKIPAFLRACTAVCFLERNFGVSIHTPIIASEVWACATPLILSRDISKKKHATDRALRDEHNVLLADPQNHAELATKIRLALTDPQQAAKIGRRGFEQLYQNRYTFSDYRQECVDQFNEIYEHTQSRGQILSVAEMQACLARLYVDEPFRKLFFLQPEETVRNYALTSEELKAIKGIEHSILNQFAGSLKTKRKKKFLAAYPLLFKLGQPIHRYYDRFYDLYPARPEQNTLDEVVQFGDFMCHTLRAAEDAPLFAHEVALYEKLYYLAKFKPSRRDSFEQINEKPKPSAQFTLDSRPALAEAVYIETFAHDISQITEQLREEKIEPEANLKKSVLVFQQIANSQKPRIFAITPATKKVINLCNGALTISQIITEIEQQLGQTGLEKALLQITQQLQDSHILI